MRTIKRVMSLLHLLYTLTASVERLFPLQMGDLNEEKTKVENIRREAKSAIFTRARSNVSNQLACMLPHSKVISIGLNSGLNGSFEKGTDSNLSI